MINYLAIAAGGYDCSALRAVPLRDDVMPSRQNPLRCFMPVACIKRIYRMHISCYIIFIFYHLLSFIMTFHDLLVISMILYDLR